MNEIYDAIVVGGGPAGATSAALLAKAGWNVLVIEKSQFPRAKVCGEFISGTTWPLLAQLGIVDDLIKLAGPVVRRVAVFAGTKTVSATLDMSNAEFGGRAVRRVHLDTLLLQRAKSVGAEILQPWVLTAFEKKGQIYHCCIGQKSTGQVRHLRSRLIIAAHGSWEVGVLPTSSRRAAARGGDLFGFKGYFFGSTLPRDLMPLIAFPGGYGGIVHTGSDRVSLSCCIRRDQLNLCRKRWPRVKAGTAVLSHIKDSCAGVARNMAAVELADTWLSAGPLRTGIRSFGSEGIFAVGNAAAEAHPIIAEGISMAIQSAFLLCNQLIESRASVGSPLILDTAGHEYELQWRKNFSRRVYIAAALAHVFMRPPTARVATTILTRLPRLLTVVARWSGKSQAFPSALSHT